MRHGKKFNHLSRKTGHRRALLSNMACSLIERKRITTTVAKAKALRKYVEPLLTKSKDDSTQSRRVVFSYLQNKEAVSELFRDVAPKIADRPGGYTRILKTGNRLGDNADMCFIELVDFNETYVSDKKDKKTTRRSRRGGSKPKEEGSLSAKTTETADVVVEEVKAEVVEEVETMAEEITEEVIAEVKDAEVVVEEAEEAPKAEVETVEPEAKTEEAPEPEAKAAEPEAKAEDKEDSKEGDAAENKDADKNKE